MSDHTHLVSVTGLAISDMLDEDATLVTVTCDGDGFEIMFLLDPEVAREMGEQLVASADRRPPGCARPNRAERRAHGRR